jgi:hypothetical protein
VLCFNVKIRFRLDLINTVNLAAHREGCGICSSLLFNRRSFPLTAEQYGLHVCEGCLETLGSIVVVCRSVGLSVGTPLAEV